MIALSLRVPAAAEDDAVALLWELGTVGIESCDVAGTEVATLLAYFPKTVSIAEITGTIASTFPGGTATQVPVPEVDWVAEFREGFRPFHVAGFHVLPEWDSSARPGADVLIVDPGRAFGLGTHESTQLCLALLREAAGTRPLGRVLDVGAGTGILSVAAARLGASSVTALDIDPDAVAAARRHAGLNQVSLRLVHADGARCLRPEACDTLLANITAPLLIERAQELTAVFGDRAILAGLLREDAPRVMAAFASPDLHPAMTLRGEWAAVAITRLRS